VNQLQKGLIFALVQVLFVSSLGAKLLWDRSRLPRGWAATQGYDPDMPIRGRYVSLSLVLNADRIYSEHATLPQTPAVAYGAANVYLTVENGQVVANPADHFTGLMVTAPRPRGNEIVATLTPPVVYFLPEHAVDPTRTRQHGQPYLEVTVPKSGPPRPIRFGVQVGNEIKPLEAQ
jgi:hypothetical protein